VFCYAFLRVCRHPCCLFYCLLVSFSASVHTYSRLNASGVVGLLTMLWARRPGFRFPVGTRYFPLLEVARPAPGATQTPFRRVPGFFRRGFRLGRNVNLSPPSSPDVENEWSFTSSSPIHLHNIFTFTCFRVYVVYLFFVSSSIFLFVSSVLYFLLHYVIRSVCPLPEPNPVSRHLNSLSETNRQTDRQTDRQTGKTDRWSACSILRLMGAEFLDGGLLWQQALSTLSTLSTFAGQGTTLNVFVGR
jgi:hypothetical protein